MIAAAEVLGIPETVVVGILTATLGFGANWLSTRQARKSSHDQVLAARDQQLWKTLQDDNAALRNDVKALREDVRSAEHRIDELETAMTVAGVPVPPRLAA